jgi:C1A family cysteine protease
MADTYLTSGMGWLPDYPDQRDFTVAQETVTPRQAALGQTEGVSSLLSKTILPQTKEKLPASVDLTQWFSPVEDQGQLGSCTAQASVALVEYFERKAFGKHIEASRLFLYKATRNLLHWTGDRGAFLRSAMGALVLFGVPPEEYWPYDPDNFDIEPPAFCYAFAQDYQAIQYYRLDPPNTPREELLTRIKEELAAGLPCMFGFTVYGSCISQAQKNGGKIPMPTKSDKIAGGHAVVAAGYDDNMTVQNSDKEGRESGGAFRIRNSWSEGWGIGGYGWLPYDYVSSGLAVDWWSLVKSEWVDAGAFAESPPE